MEACNLQCPFAGKRCSFEHTVKNVLVGALVHDERFMFYRTANTVHKCADFIVHVFLTELQRWISEHGCMPDIIYLQGGGENANNYLLAMCELLVIKRLSHYVIFTRLPTQHSHDDLDGAFGVVKSALKGKPKFS